MRRIVLAAIFVLSGASAANAEDESCSVSCPSGQVLVSFADGNNAKCFCQDVGNQMEDTTATDINCNDPEDDGSCE